MPINYDTKKPLTLVFPIDKANKKILLGMKKRGFGAHKYNGFGGKLEPGETIEQAAHRELMEESMVEAKDMIKVGINMFSFEGNRVGMEVHVYLVTQFDGEPQETEEMRPQWFDYADIPYAQMWSDDAQWLPVVLGGESFVGEYHFAEDQTTILSQALTTVTQVPAAFPQ
ncbi:NUDIX hydrolase domain-like protein [Gongronella butleri]|nr:NUDIX hydrolase domain-like protein [Gongronella butleri]